MFIKFIIKYVCTFVRMYGAFVQTFNQFSDLDVVFAPGPETAANHAKRSMLVRKSQVLEQ